MALDQLLCGSFSCRAAYPDDLDSCERCAKACDGTDSADGEGNHIDRHLELEKAGDVVIHRPVKDSTASAY